MKPEELFGKLPLRWQHGLRDSKTFAKVVDSLMMAMGSAAVIATQPSLVVQYLRSRGLDELEADVSYGPNRRHTLDWYKPKVDPIPDAGSSPTAPRARVIVFVHGGAWALGSKRLYALHAHALAEEGCHVMVLNYRLHPWATSREQADDVNLALRWVRGAVDASVTVLGHSSGAHVTMMAAIQAAEAGETLCDGIVLMSGVYDIAAHYEFEKTRGIHEISALKPANGGGYDYEAGEQDMTPKAQAEAFARHSPTILVDASSDSTIANLPGSIVMMHGGMDVTVPPSQSVALHRSLQRRGLRPQFTLLDSREHVDIHLDSALRKPEGRIVNAIIRRSLL